jgi:hypothetical protein
MLEPGCCTYVVAKKKATTTFRHNRLIFFVVWAGIEPATQGFSVLCSTN